MSRESQSLWAKVALFFCWLGRKIKAAGRWYVGLYRGTPWYKKLCAAVLSFLAFVVFYIFAVSVNLFWLFGRSPSINSIMNPRTAAASEIYSEDSVLIGRFFSENRQPVPYDSISPVFFDALISTEDERFYRHHGIDFQGLVAAVKDAFRGRARGASTITQQLVKNMFRVRTEYSTGLLGYIPGVKILVMKSKEMILAVELEMFYSKREILNMYANTVDFGSNAFGIKTAAKTYFDTTPSRLKPEEAAVLVGLLKATSAYNPRINPDNSLRRRNTVLDNMCTHGHLTPAECDSLKDLPIDLKFKVETVYDGKALYFREAVADYLKEKLPDVDLYSDGLKIYTTLNMRMQRYAEAAVSKQMRIVQRNFDNHWGKRAPWVDERGQEIPHFIEDLAEKTDAYKILSARYSDAPDSVTYYLNQPHPVKLFTYDGPKTELMSTMDSIRYMVRFMHTGFVAMEPENGHVKVWVGDIDFQAWKYDKVTAMRQPGSTFKLFVYTEAMNQGMTPADRMRDEFISMEVYDAKKKETTLWQPHNANGYFTGDSIPLRAAFARSINTIAVKLGQRARIDRVAETAHAMGIKSPLDETPALALGASDVNLLEMVNAYATVANNGRHVEPVLVTKVVDRDGEVIYEAAEEGEQVIPYRSAFFMQQLLRAGVNDGGGTSQSLRRYVGQYAREVDFGGKTGTSNNHSDAWFIGTTPGLVGGAWVGGEYRSIHFRTGALGQGSRTALPIFGYFMESVLGDPLFHDKYARKYGDPKEKIDASLYEVTYAPARLDTDTVAVDSAAILMGDSLGVELRFDENGVPTLVPAHSSDSAARPASTTTTPAARVTQKDADQELSRRERRKLRRQQKKAGEVQGAQDLI